MPETTATDPATGIVHIIADENYTACGKNAAGWSRAVTVVQLAGLALTCEACNE